MQLLRDIFGQDAAIAQLRTAYQQDRLPHGMIFSGPHGVGKGTTARAMAAWFLCERPGKDDACGTCSSCHLLTAGTHPDYHLVFRQLVRLQKKDSKARDLSIDVIRAHVLEPSARKAMQNRGKVFIIEEAETMTRDAANSLLKTLEEPQGRTMMILLTDQAQYLLPTIRSRCQPVHFAALPEEIVVARLQERGIDRETAQLATRMAEGSLGLATQWTEDGLVAAARPLYQRLDAVLANRPVEDLPAFLGTLAGQLYERELGRDKEVSKDQATREATVLLLRLCADYLRQRLPEADPAGALRICGMIDDIAQSQQYIAGNVNVNLVLEHIGNRIR